MKYQYTIAGKVIQGSGINDSAGFLSQLGIAIGSSVSFTFIIDLSAPGFIKHTDGTMQHVPNSYYVKHISGTTLTAATFLPSRSDNAEHNVGNSQWLILYPPNAERAIEAGNGNNYLRFLDMKQQPDSRDSWQVGSNFGCPNMQNIIYDASGRESSFFFEATIINIVSPPLQTPGDFHVDP